MKRGDYNSNQSLEYAEREKAAATLISIGEKCLPYLKKELEQASSDTEWWIKNVIWQIEHQANLE